jgi:hypothetical protein
MTARTATSGVVVRPPLVEIGSEEDDEGEDAQQYQGDDSGPHAGYQI